MRGLSSLGAWAGAAMAYYRGTESRHGLGGPSEPGSLRSKIAVTLDLRILHSQRPPMDGTLLEVPLGRRVRGSERDDVRARQAWASNSPFFVSPPAVPLDVPIVAVAAATAVGFAVAALDL